MKIIKYIIIFFLVFLAIYGIICGISFSLFLYNLGKLNFDALEHTAFIEFNENKIYVKTRSWGLTGDHYYIFFSSAEKNRPDDDHLNLYQIGSSKINPLNGVIEISNNNDLVFNDMEIYYKKVELNKLIIYCGNNTLRSTINTKINTIDIDIIFIDIFGDLIKNYKNYGLKKISIYRGIEDDKKDTQAVNKNAFVLFTNLQSN